MTQEALLRRVLRLWLNPGPTQRCLHELSLRRGVRLAITSVRLCEAPFEQFVVLTQLGLGSQQVAEPAQLLDVWVVVLNEVYVVCSRLRPWTQKPQAPGTIRI